ncbi:MAG: site-specific integrase [Thermodesulfobacterium sp.]|jgi:site-specific recombinase XerD|nr:site-specific integrase [Thermodesulfobacterium sp.]
MAKTNFQTSFKNEHQASYLARDIASYFNRGSSLENRIETVLNHFREWTSTRSLKQISEERIEAFVSTLRDKVESGELSKKSAESYLSAFNRVLEYVNTKLDKSFELISPKEAGLSRGSFEFVDRAVSQATHEKFLSFLSGKEDIRAQSLVYSTQLQRLCGLRLKESIAIKLETVEKALETGVLHLSKTDGTKNGREREIPIRNEDQREALLQALSFMKENNLSSLCPTEKLREQYHFAEQMAKEFKEETKESFTFHGERHAFAQQAVQEGIDRATVSSWLGHNREEVTKVYIK